MKILISKSEFNEIMDAIKNASVENNLNCDIEQLTDIQSKVTCDNCVIIDTAKLSIKQSDKNTNNVIANIDSNILRELVSSIIVPSFVMLSEDIRPTTQEKVKTLFRKKIKKIILKFGFLGGFFK